MRLRKNMKRTAAAVLALSMAVSAVAAPASAAYICDVSQGNVVVSKDESGTSITVGGKKVENDGDGSEDILITGDNARNKVQVMPGGGYSTVEIILPPEWDALMQEAGYAPLSWFYRANPSPVRK